MRTREFFERLWHRVRGHQITYYTVNHLCVYYDCSCGAILFKTLY